VVGNERGYKVARNTNIGSIPLKRGGLASEVSGLGAVIAERELDDGCHVSIL